MHFVLITAVVWTEISPFRANKIISFLTSVMSASTVQRVILLVGPPGSGKSTFAKALTRVVPVTNKSEPFFLTLTTASFRAVFFDRQLSSPLYQ
jgi:MoxR-like ATPase